MQEKLIKSIGESLMSLGLYTVAFESTALAFRAMMKAYLESKGEDLSPLYEACDTAYKTFSFCGPKLLEMGVLTKDELDELNRIRKQRNVFTHESYNHAIDFPIERIDSDVRKLYEITRKVELAKFKAKENIPTEYSHKTLPDGTVVKSKTVQFSVSPAIFGLYIEAANDISRTYLSDEA